MASKASRAKQAAAKARARAKAQAAKERKAQARAKPQKGVAFKPTLKPRKIKPLPGLKPTKPGTQTTTIPGRPGVPTPRVQPFMSPTDMLNKMQFDAAQRDKAAEDSYTLATQEANTAQQREQLKRQATKQRSGVSDAMAARGLFNSSLRDAALFDVGAQEALATGALDTALTATRTRVEALRRSAAQASTEFTAALNAQMAANAREASIGLPQWATPPTAPRTVTAQAPTARRGTAAPAGQKGRAFKPTIKPRKIKPLRKGKTYTSTIKPRRI